MSFLPANSYQINNTKVVLHKNTYHVFMSFSSRLQGGVFDEKITSFAIPQLNFETFLIEYCLFTLYQDKYLEEFTLYSKEITASKYDKHKPWSWLYYMAVETQDWPMNFDENSKDYKLMNLSNKARINYYDKIGNKFDVNVDEDLIKNHIKNTLGQGLSFNQIVLNTSTLIEKLYITDGLPSAYPEHVKNIGKMKV